MDTAAPSADIGARLWAAAARGLRRSGAMEGENAEVEQTVREMPGAISYLGFAYISSAGLRVLAIDTVAPTRENVQSGAWPIGGKGYAITKGAPSDAARAFLDWLTGAESQNSPAFARLGYVPLAK